MTTFRFLETKLTKTKDIESTPSWVKLSFCGIPVRKLILLVSVWVLLGFASYFVNRVLDLRLDTTDYFPLYGTPVIHSSGIPYAIVFLVALFVILRLSPPSHHVSLRVWALGLWLLLFGNLVQGGYYQGFIAPFEWEGTEYYHDAIKIGNWRSWLSDFNTIQPDLLDHSRTHPPFAVLSHHVLLNDGGGIDALSVCFVLLTSLLVPMTYRIMRDLGVNQEEAYWLALLFAVLPAFNIYGAVSLDGVIAMIMTAGLWGLVRTVRLRLEVLGSTLFLAGVILSNLLSFGATFLIAVAGLVAVRQVIVQRRYDVTILVVGTIAAAGGLLWSLNYFLDYDHIEAFLTASRLENPQGFMLFHWPANYVMTRLEGIGDILFCLSFGILGVFFHHHNLRFGFSNSTAWFPLAATTVLLLMFLVGTFKTGETARACLFIYPYLVLIVSTVPSKTIRCIVLLAGLQTCGMQIFGNFYW